jgi:hypothetical protein
MINHEYGVLIMKLLYLNGSLHKEDGPAVVKYNSDGNHSLTAKPHIFLCIFPFGCSHLLNH